MTGRSHRNHDAGRQADPGAAAERGKLRRDQAKHLREHPRADREIMTAQPEQQAGRRQCHHRPHHAGERQGEQRMKSADDGGREQHVAAEADIGLLPDRNEAGIAGEQVPQARKRDVGVDVGEQP